MNRHEDFKREIDRGGLAPPEMGRRSPDPTPSRPGFTLVELLVTLAIVALIMAALGSATLIASRAAPQRGGVSNALLEAEQAQDLIAADLRYAQSVSEAAATAVAFTVADRDGDGAVETIRYSWSGAAGAPLLRRYNGSAPAEVLRDVRELNFDYHRLAVNSTREVQTEATSPEVLFASFTGWPGVSASTREYTLGTGSWAVQLFYIDKQPLPAETTKVRITRVLLMLKPDDALLGLGSSECTVGIHRKQGGSDPRPASTALGTVKLSLSPGLLGSSYTWAEARFSNVVVNNLEKHFAIVAKGVSTMYAQYLHSTAAPRDNGAMVWTSNSGSTWNPALSSADHYDMPFYVYGTYTTTSTSQVAYTAHYLKSVRVRLRSGPAPAARLLTTVAVLERPEVPPP